MPTHTKYSVCIRLTQRHQQTNIGYTARLTNAYTHQIFSWYPANQMTSTNKYWICHQPMPTHTEYFVSIRLTQQHHPTNIGYAIRLTNANTRWIFCRYLANPTASTNKYWISRQANQCLLFVWHLPNPTDSYRQYWLLSSSLMYIPDKYPLSARLIWWHRLMNIWYFFRLTNIYIQ